MQAGERLLSRSYHTLLRLVLIGSLFHSNKEEHQTACNQQTENDKQDDERPIRSCFNGEGIDGTVAALIAGGNGKVIRGDILDIIRIRKRRARISSVA